MPDRMYKHTTLYKVIDNAGGLLQTDNESTGWGFFSPEVSFFLVDFCKQQLSPIQTLIFYPYYVNGMTLKEISERLYGPEQQESFSKEEECDEDDSKCTDKNFHATHQAVHHQIVKIEKKLRYSWKYMDRWDDSIVTKKRKRKKKEKE